MDDLTAQAFAEATVRPTGAAPRRQPLVGVHCRQCDTRRHQLAVIANTSVGYLMTTTDRPPLVHLLEREVVDVDSWGATCPAHGWQALPTVDELRRTARSTRR